MENGTIFREDFWEGLKPCLPPLPHPPTTPAYALLILMHATVGVLQYLLVANCNLFLETLEPFQHTVLWALYSNHYQSPTMDTEHTFPAQLLLFAPVYK